jgi:hypothetical protein
MPTVELDTFTSAYVEAALWSSTDNANDQGGEPLDANYDIDDIAPDTLAEMVEDCASFQRMFGAYIADEEERAGHDFWLTRNGHGAGFWDGDWEQPYVHDIQPDEPEWHAPIGRYETVGDYLTAMSEPYGSYDLYVGDDGLIHGQ